VVSRQASRHPGLSALLLVLALTVGLPAGGAAQHADRAVVGARYVSVGAPAASTSTPHVFSGRLGMKIGAA
jgi:hypothetical protein